MKIKLKLFLVVALIALEALVSKGLVEAFRWGKEKGGSAENNRGQDRGGTFKTFGDESQIERNNAVQSRERKTNSRNRLSSSKDRGSTFNTDRLWFIQNGDDSQIETNNAVQSRERKTNSRNRSSSGNDKSFSKESSRNIFGQLMEIFKVTVPGVFSEKLKQNYDMNSIQLIYPATLDKVRSLKRCVITAQTKSNSKLMHSIKLELTSGLRAVYDTQTNEISCSAKRLTSGNLPAEHKMNLMFQGKPNFLKYYEAQSGLVPTTVSGVSMMAYVSEYLKGSMDLHAWSLKNIRKYKPVEYETQMRVIFAKIYEALESLRLRGYVYTDLKPANILIDAYLNPYLIDLESVIQKTSANTCVATPRYFPPNYLRKSLRPENMERILSWTFCMSVYETICVKSNKSPMSFFSNKNSGNFIDYFKCDRPISDHGKEFLNKCLTKNDSPDSFRHLRQLDWIKYDLLLLKY